MCVCVCLFVGFAFDSSADAPNQRRLLDCDAVPEKVGKGANGAAVCLLFVCFSVGSRKQNERKQKSALQDVAVVCVCVCV